jgi:hypothetical protein
MMRWVNGSTFPEELDSEEVLVLLWPLPCFAHSRAFQVQSHADLLTSPHFSAVTEEVDRAEQHVVALKEMFSELSATFPCWKTCLAIGPGHQCGPPDPIGSHPASFAGSPVHWCPQKVARGKVPHQMGHRLRCSPDN